MKKILNWWWAKLFPNLNVVGNQTKIYSKCNRTWQIFFSANGLILIKLPCINLKAMNDIVHTYAIWNENILLNRVSNYKYENFIILSGSLCKMMSDYAYVEKHKFWLKCCLNLSFSKDWQQFAEQFLV